MMRFILAFFPLFLISACAMQNHSFVSNEPIKIENETAEHEMPADKVSRSVLNHIADDVNRRGTGDVTVTVHYMMKKPLKATQHIADTQGKRVQSYLVQQGIKRRVIVQTEPDQDSTPNRITIFYEAMRAKAPAHCRDISQADADRFGHKTDSDYYYGCTGDSYLSQMIARPGDLLGNDTSTLADSQRLNKSLENYRAGERATKEQDEGVSASNVYSTQ